MITEKTNIKEVIDNMVERLESLQPGGAAHGTIMREIATTMRAETARRIHSEGLNAQGQKIGDYSPAYAKLKTKAGRNQLGTVNLSFSGQLANQYSIIETQNSYGLGWIDSEKAQRAEYLEERYGQVWALTTREKILTTQIADQQVSEIIKN